MSLSLDVQSSTLLTGLTALRGEIHSGAQQILSQYMPGHAELAGIGSALNLAHYLALRRRDLRALQEDLAEAGVSSLGRCESHVMATLDQVISILQKGYSPPPTSVAEGYPSYKEGKSLLELNATRLFGPKDRKRNTRIMVTLPTEAAFDSHLIQDLVAKGMNCARINCAHDDRAVWRAMIDNVILARQGTGKDCTILMDLAGQKIRTRMASAERDGIKLKVLHDGNTVEPALIAFISVEASSPSFARTWVAVPAAVHKQFEIGDRLFFTDARGKQRHIDIISRGEVGSWIGFCERNSIITTETLFELQRRDQWAQYSPLCEFTTVRFPARTEQPRLFVDDRLLLCRDVGTAVDGLLRVGCTHPLVLGQLRPGHAVWFDDGKLGTIVEHADEQCATLRVIYARPSGVKLRDDKGINFPDIHLDLPCLTDKDLEDLDFVCKYADMVGFSFVQSARDMEILMKAMVERDAKHLSIIAKIETKVAVMNLPGIILTTLPHHRLGVMIARGDLAVELGGDRMAEIQEELLWLCEAAHVPVIWATQVLEGLTKKGASTRPELTDAAMSGRAECVMLNKGPYLSQAVTTLDSILTRMQDHQYKKVSRLRALHW
jgi:pyruvate kinase